MFFQHVVPTLFLFGILVLTVRGLRKPSAARKKTDPEGISIIIPFRNEAHNLYNLLKSLASQNVSVPFEIILVNDSSSDDYEMVCRRAKNDFSTLNFRIIENRCSEIHLTSKQKAIDTGADHAHYSLLVFTDADMIFSPLWLESLCSAYDPEISPFVFGRTAVSDGSGFFWFVQKIQLEFLFASAHILANAGADSSCMGNNIAVSKALYQKIGGQKGIGYTIVEDKKLLSAVKKTGAVPVPAEPFIPMAFTHAEKPKVFLHQMLRWIRGGAGESLQLLALMTLLGLQLCSGVLFVTGNMDLWGNTLFICGAAVCWFLFIAEFHRIKPAFYGVLLPLYLIILSLESLIVIPALLFISPRWKGRKLN